MEKINYIISLGDCCVPAIFIRNNKARIGSSLIFDWARSNLGSVCDTIENGMDWYIQNNIYSTTTYDNKDYQFKELSYPHHHGDIDYQIRCTDRFFDILKYNTNIVFLYMTAYKIPIYDLTRLKDSLIKKYKNINFKIVAAISENIGNPYDIIHNNIDDYIDIYRCNSPSKFINNFMRDDDFYNKLFKVLIPYELDIKTN